MRLSEALLHQTPLKEPPPLTRIRGVYSDTSLVSAREASGIIENIKLNVNSKIKIKHRPIIEILDLKVENLLLCNSILSSEFCIEQIRKRETLENKIISLNLFKLFDELLSVYTDCLQVWNSISSSLRLSDTHDFSSQIISDVFVSNSKKDLFYDYYLEIYHISKWILSLRSIPPKYFQMWCSGIIRKNNFHEESIKILLSGINILVVESWNSNEEPFLSKLKSYLDENEKVNKTFQNVFWKDKDRLFSSPDRFNPNPQPKYSKILSEYFDIIQNFYQFYKSYIISIKPIDNLIERLMGVKNRLNNSYNNSQITNFNEFKNKHELVIISLSNSCISGKDFDQVCELITGKRDALFHGQAKKLHTRFVSVIEDYLKIFEEI